MIFEAQLYEYQVLYRHSVCYYGVSESIRDTGDLRQVTFANDMTPAEKFYYFKLRINWCLC